MTGQHWLELLDHDEPKSFLSPEVFIATIHEMAGNVPVKRDHDVATPAHTIGDLDDDSMLFDGGQIR